MNSPELPDALQAPEDAPVITIDGPSGSGKGTVALAVAKALGWRILDSGALYRLTGLMARRAGIDLADGTALAKVAADLRIEFRPAPGGGESLFVGEENLTALIRTEDCAADASLVAAQAPVRAALIDVQRACRRPPGLVADGRDMGSVIFPDAALKIYLTASVPERAERRHKQLKEQGIDVSLSALCSDISARDQRDAARTVAPLRAPEGAVRVDSTAMTVAEVVAGILVAARQAGIAGESGGQSN